MLKTNNKTVEMKVLNYLKEEIATIDGDNETLETGLQYMIEYFNENNQYDYVGCNNIITFTRNMGTAFPMYFEDMRDLLKEWLEETEEEANRYDNDKVAATFDNLLERVLFKYFKLSKTVKYNFRGVEHSKAYVAVVGGAF
jgi:hypothetical protein